MTIPPGGEGDTGWDIDVVLLGPDPVLFQLDVTPMSGGDITLQVARDVEPIDLNLAGAGNDGQMGPTGPAGPPGPAGEATSVVLTAPDGGRWQLVVDNSGALSTVPA